MSKPFNARRSYAIRAAIAKKDAINDNTVMLKNGVRVAITTGNAKFAETLRRKDAESAYEQAAMSSIPALAA